MNRILLKYKTPLLSHSSKVFIPYKEQYESRDNENEIKKRKIEMSIEKQTKILKYLSNYNPHKNKTHVSQYLPYNLKHYYLYKYKNN
tara:strand:+ start:86 stop:346 length:261 start_codon:yes stop_codon:yes gene_type:complete